MENLSLIVALGNNSEIGFQNQLLCHLPADLKYFKKVTSGHTVMMGDKTWESLPFKPLPRRRNIVITLNRQAQYDNCEVVFSIDEALQLIDNEPEAFVIGGATIYKLMLPHVNKLYLTRICADFQADAFFPTINFNEWTILEESFLPKDANNIYDLHFQILQRIH